MADKKDLYMRLIIQPIISDIQKVVGPIEEAFKKSSKTMGDTLSKGAKDLAKEFEKMGKQLEGTFNKMVSAMSGGVRGMVSSAQSGLKDLAGKLVKGLAGGAGGAAGGEVAGAGLEGMLGPAMFGGGGAEAGAAAIGAAAPEILVLLAIIAVAVVGIMAVMKIVGDIIEATLGPIMKMFDLMLKIITAPFKLLGTFIAVTMMPYITLSTMVSRALMAFFGQFMVKYQTSLLGRMTGTMGYANESANPEAAQMAAGAEAMTYMFGSILIQLNTLLTNAMTEVTAYLMKGMVSAMEVIINLIPGVSVSFENVRNAIDLGKDALIQMNNEGAVKAMQGLDILSKAAGDLTYDIAVPFWDSVKAATGALSGDEAGLEAAVSGNALAISAEQKIREDSAMVVQEQVIPAEIDFVNSVTTGSSEITTGADMFKTQLEGAAIHAANILGPGSTFNAAVYNAADALKNFKEKVEQTPASSSGGGTSGLNIGFSVFGGPTFTTTGPNQIG